jgi:protein TonB
MSYANKRQMSTNRTPAIIVVALIHLALGYALVTGLAYNVAKKAMEDLKTFDVTEEPPPPEEQPPPPEKTDTPPPPQIVAPPPLVRTNQTAPPIISTPVAPPPQITPRAPPAPPAPPAPRIEPARAKANLASYVSNDDYPSDAVNREESGTTGFRLDVGPDGRVSNCTITSSSGSRSLDATTCRLMKSRARFTPATNSSGAKVADSVNSRIRWVLPAN